MGQLNRPEDLLGAPFLRRTRRSPGFEDRLLDRSPLVLRSNAPQSATNPIEDLGYI